MKPSEMPVLGMHLWRRLDTPEEPQKQVVIPVTNGKGPLIGAVDVDPLVLKQMGHCHSIVIKGELSDRAFGFVVSGERLAAVSSQLPYLAQASFFWDAWGVKRLMALEHLLRTAPRDDEAQGYRAHFDLLLSEVGGLMRLGAEKNWGGLQLTPGQHSAWKRFMAITSKSSFSKS